MPRIHFNISYVALSLSSELERMAHLVAGSPEDGFKSALDVLRDLPTVCGTGATAISFKVRPLFFVL